LDYYRARYYDPGVGRFIRVDPAGFGAGDTNLYRYVGNSSTNATDPTGMWVNFVAGAFIGGVLDVGMQLWENRGTDKGIDLTRLAISTISGAVGGGIGGALLKQGTGLAARTALNAGVGFNLGYWGKVADNKIKGQELTDGALATGIAGGLGAGAGELISDGVGAALRSEGVQSALAKATSVGGEIWENASSNLARKTSSAIDRAWESEGFQSFLTKGLNLTNRGLNKIEESLQWQNQSSQQILRRRLGSIENALEKFESNIGNTKISDTLYESLVVNRLNYKSDIRTHLTNYEGYHYKKGFRGGHTFDSFKQGLKENPDTFITDIRTHPSQPHLYEVKYARPALDSKQRVIANQDRPFPYPKTLYDNGFISDDKIFRYGQIAAAKGYNRFITGQLPKNRVNSPTSYKTSSGNIWFNNTIDANNQITNHHPMFPDRNILFSTGLTTLP
jgi:hypothetical protein